MGVSPVPGVSLGSLWFFQIKSGLLVASHVSLLWVLKYRRGLNYGWEEGRNAVSSCVLLSFFPCFRLPLINVLPKFKLIFLLQWCISQCSHMFGWYILSHSSPLSENKFTNPTKYQLHFTYWITRLHQSCINPVSLQHTSHDPLLALTECLGTPPLLLQLFSSFLCNGTGHSVSPFIYKVEQLHPTHTYIICSLWCIQHGQIGINVSKFI